MSNRVMFEIESKKNNNNKIANENPKVGILLFGKNVNECFIESYESFVLDVSE